jgi:hypothetical protein
MRGIAILSLLLALPLCASTGNIWFDPPNPTSRTPVVAHITTVANCGIHAEVGPPPPPFLPRWIDLSVDPGNCTPASTDVAVDLGVLAPGVYQVQAGYTPPNILIGLGDAVLTVSDANAQFTFAPRVIRTSGGTVVIHPSPAYGAGCPNANCPTPAVTFDGVRATVSSASNESIVVQAPPHDHGPIDVMINAVLIRGAVEYYDLPEDPAFFEPVLFPTMVTGSGAFGSLWSTEAALRNDNEYPLPLTRTIFGTVDAHATALIAHADEPSGYLFMIARDAAPRMTFGILAKDLSRHAEGLGTQLPVVREHQFFDRPFSILNVPSDTRYRVTLRLYAIDGATRSLPIRILPLNTNEVLVDDTLLFGYAESSPATLLSSVTGDLLTKYPQLAGKGPLRIEINGVSNRPVTWGFVSVTNNQTQNITVLTPQ